MGIVLGALGGMGESMMNIGNANQKAWLEDENSAKRSKRESDLALQREETMAVFKTNLATKTADQQREAQVSRIGAAKEGIVGNAINSKYASSDEAVAAANAGQTDAPLTPEQQAVIDKAKQGDKAALMADPKTQTQAAIATGDISQKDAATLGVKDETLLYKAMWEQAKEEGRNKRSDDRIAASAEASDKRLAYLFTALEKRGEKGKDGVSEALKFVDGARKEIASEAQNLRQLMQSELKDVFDPAEKKRIQDDYAAKFKDIDRKRTEIESDFNNLREKVGLPAKAEAPTPTAAPKAAAMPALPAGSKKIGTSGGKAVYETPDGKRFIEN